MSHIDPKPENITQTRTYINPVYKGYFADPFVWKYQDVYYAIGTGAAEAEGQIDEISDATSTGSTNNLCVFPLLRSFDFLNWHFVGNALKRPDSALGDNFWAPEVAYSDSKFYLYYSVGHEDKNHQLRVATSDTPLGPYEDVGEPLVDPNSCPFAIDPHPFRDDDGQWYLFYARDFLDTGSGMRAGTALYVDRLQSMTKLSGFGKTVLRARSDWQRFLSNRLMYGEIFDWHTLEGPCVRKHEGRYYCFYSGGRWETENYGVDYGVADNVMGPYSDAGNETGPRVLRSLRGHVLGPGHNSIVLGLDEKTEYMVYHAWGINMAARQMCMDKLIWTLDGPRCNGPTWTLQTITEKSQYEG
ncbi:glycoside hydrolase family 43 protein [Scytonema sp. NUACC26]|uniref:glycoside hydrolase family 43 protein n=1 Tax=Scytonema sp. NUACC26 TaxID=3140176 RepID=UPI0034DB973E